MTAASSHSVSTSTVVTFPFLLASDALPKLRPAQVPPTVSSLTAKHAQKKGNSEVKVFSFRMSEIGGTIKLFLPLPLSLGWIR